MTATSAALSKPASGGVAPAASATAETDLLYEVRDGVARITFNRPQARNALTFAMYERMAEICRSINDDPSRSRC